MENIVNTLNNNYVILGIIVVNIILLILYISSNVKLRRLNKEYRNFMKKIGKGEDIDENLKVYIKKVEKVEKENKEIIQYCEDLNKELAKTIRKVLNGIYSREMSNIYAKPIKAGKSKYTISEQEQEAIDKAIESNGYNVIE